MPLPYPDKVVLPFDIATAQDMNERHANDVALAEGTGLNDGAVTTAALADGAVTPEKRSGGFAVGTFNANITTVNITTGFLPRVIRFFIQYSDTVQNVQGQGVWCNGSNYGVASVSRPNNDTARTTHSNTYSILQTSSTTNLVQGSVTSVSETGFTVTFASTLSGTSVVYEAYG